jgi:hypothetical protein
MLHRPADGQFQLLKGAEEDQVVTEVIRAKSVGCVFGGSATRWTQVAGKQKLRTSIPTVFQRNIVLVLFNAVRIRRDNKDCILHTTKLESKIQSSTYMHEHCIYNVHTWYVHVCTVYEHYLWIHSMKAVFWHIKGIASGTHDAPAQI